MVPPPAQYSRFQIKSIRSTAVNRFYEKYRFVSPLDDPRHLLLPIKVIRKLKRPPLFPKLHLDLLVAKMDGDKFPVIRDAPHVHRTFLSKDRAVGNERYLTSATEYMSGDVRSIVEA